MIDLHLHTNASDGSSSPEELMKELADAGVTTFAVTDHDTVAGLPAVTTLAAQAGLECVPGIEVTAVLDGHDVHILGYLFDPQERELEEFLVRQLEDCRRRLVAMAERLCELGVPVDAQILASEASRESRRSLGRPLLARALVGAGYVRTIHEAFDKYLSVGRPAFVERVGAEPAEVCGLIGRAGGLASLAHPAKLHESIAVRVPVMGFDAIEVYHPDHEPEDIVRLRALADEQDLCVTGGSDFHGRGSGRKEAIGKVGLPADDYLRLVERAVRRRAHV